MSLWIAFASLVLGAVGSLFPCVVFLVSGNIASSLALVAAGLVCAGLAIFMFYGCKAITAGILLLTRKFAVWMKNCFIKRKES